MPTNTFGRRGANAPAGRGGDGACPANTFGRRDDLVPALVPDPRPAFRPAAAPITSAIEFDRARSSSNADTLYSDNKLLADIPFLTAGLIFCLTLIFGLERSLAIDIAGDGSLGRSLIAFGAVSRDLVVGMGEWWRIGLAPLLHGSASHLIGNSVALFVVGIRLEPLIGRGWFLLIFVASGLAGVVGSLLGNAPGVMTVGASGAITGLISALFVASFNPYADADDRRVMLKTSLFFGVPALAPLAFGASGNVDYFAHAGGALAGVALAVTLWFVRSHDSVRPNYAHGAGMTALAGLVGSFICVGFAAAHYASYMADAAQFIRASELTDAHNAVGRSADLVARYPKDPQAHFIRALYFISQKRLGDAEVALRTTMSLAASDVAGGPVRTQAQAVLAALLLDQGRHDEAKAMAAEPCRAKGQDELHRMLAQVKLCD